MKHLIKWLTACSLLLPVMHACAQTPAGLSIGEKVPERVWNALPVNKDAELIILDFWNTWCTSCIAAFPKMESLQQQFGKKINIVLITTDTHKDIQALYARKNMQGKRLPRFPSITSDTVWGRLFPYRMVPQHVWIGKDRTVVAITEGANTDAAGISRFLQEGSIVLKEKRDLIDFDYDLPLFSGKDMPADQLVSYSILIRGKVGLPGKERSKRAGDAAYRLTFTNRTLLRLYESIMHHMVSGYSRKRQILEVQEDSTLEALYSYDIIVPIADTTRLHEYMLQDLNRYSPLYGSVEQRNITYLSLQRSNSATIYETQGGPRKIHYHNAALPSLLNVTFAHLTTLLNAVLPAELPIVDETGYKGRIDIRFSGPVQDIPGLRIELAKYGLQLVEKKGVIDMFVIRNKEGR
ncbi:thioredoxin domain-containing protein [Chitinophaga sp.]|uniref:thioredoxin domain-containing protein n=1 Tax=Chitinophaga sp. TaxID=1869181 RepID=UPI0031E43162